MIDIKNDDVMELYYDKSKYSISKILLPFKGIIRRIFILSFLINILTLMIPLFLMLLIDGKIILSFEFKNLVNLVFLISILGFNFIFRYIRAKLINFVLFNIDTNICGNILDKVFKISSRQIEKKTEAFWNTLFADIDVIRNGLSGSYIMNLFDMPFILLFIGVVGILLGKYFFIILLFSLIYAIFILFTSYLLGMVDDKEKLAIKERDELVSSSIYNLSSLKTLSLTDKIVNMWQDYQRSIVDITYKRNSTLDICLVFNFIIYFVGIVVFSLMGIYAFNLNISTVGAMVAILLLFSQNFYLINNFIKYLPEYFKFINSIERLSQVMAEQVEALKTEVVEDVTLGHLVLEKVVLEDACQNSILKDVDFSFKEGSIYVVKAKNTFETSIFLKSLFAGYDIVSGNILFDRYNVANLQTDSLKNYIHYTAENYFIIEGSIKENLNCFISKNNTDSSYVGFIDYKKSSEMLGLDEIVKKLPNAYNTIIDSKTNLMSQEELKLLSIARMFVGNPKVMLFDQPFVGLGKVYKEKLITALNNVVSEKIVIISAFEKKIVNKIFVNIEEEKIVILDTEVFEETVNGAEAKTSVQEDTVENRALFRRIFRKK